MPIIKCNKENCIYQEDGHCEANVIYMNDVYFYIILIIYNILYIGETPHF